MIKQILVSSCVLFSATFVVQAQNPKLGVSPIQDVINAMTLDEKIQLVVGSTGKYESQMEATIGNQGQLVQGAAGQVNGIERLGIPATVVADALLVSASTLSARIPTRRSTVPTSLWLL